MGVTQAPLIIELTSVVPRGHCLRMHLHDRNLDDLLGILMLFGDELPNGITLEYENGLTIEFDGDESAGTLFLWSEVPGEEPILYALPRDEYRRMVDAMLAYKVALYDCDGAEGVDDDHSG